MYAELNRRICNTCKQQKDLSEYNRDIRDKDLKTRKCRACIRKYRHQPKIRNYDVEYNRRYAIKNADHIRKRTRKTNLRRMYGASQELYEQFSKIQNDRCAICFIHVSKTRYDHLCIDHCHKTKEIRGLLCDNCNRGIGLLKDDENVLLSAAEYLRRFRTRG